MWGAIAHLMQTARALLQNAVGDFKRGLAIMVLVLVVLCSFACNRNQGWRRELEVIINNGFLACNCRRL